MTEQKQKLQIQRAQEIASTFEKAESFGQKKVERDLSGYHFEVNCRVLVCNLDGLVLFDSSKVDRMQGRYLLLPEVLTALDGKEVFKARMQQNAQQCKTAVPIKIQGNVIGAVYMWESDPTPIKVLSGIRGNFFWLSIFVSLIFIISLFVFSTKLVGRLKKMITGIRHVQDGAYGEQIPQEGNDELTELSREFNELSRRIHETEELRRTFVSDASHELRTPLSSIRLLTDSIIQTENIDVATTKEFMADIGEEIDRLTRIAERLLVLTRLDGAKKLILEPVDLKKISETAIVTLEPLAQEASVTIEKNLAEECLFLGNADGAYQIVFNLIENAIKYNRAGGNVRVFLFMREDKCHLIVDDTGIGIAKEDYDKIFERFYRVDKARSRSGKGGTGLGLAIVRKNVENYYGQISVEPSVMGGVRFTVTFPKYTKEVTP